MGTRELSRIGVFALCVACVLAGGCAAQRANARFEIPGEAELFSAG